MKIFITGGAGYIGSMLIEELLKKGYYVICLDKLLFGDRGIRDFIGTKNFELIIDDTRTFDPNILKNVDVVIDLAAISQPDPTNQINKTLFHEINYLGPLRVVQLSKKHGVKKYIFASTCSVYGFQEKIVTETSNTNPLEEYAKTKIKAENEIKKFSSNKFCVTILRFATLYGLSKKMRFDLVVNAMTLSLYKTGIINVMNPGTQVRPVIHVLDAVKAIINVIEAEKEIIDGEVFNVGSNEQNYQIYQLAKIVGESIGKSYEIRFYGQPDLRSYIVDFTKIKQVLKFKTSFTPSDGAKEIYKALEDRIITDELYTNVINWWKHLQENRIVYPLFS